MEREEKKAEYLEHFADAFAEYGIDKTSVKKLASAAGINEASIYQYFKNKDEIIIELVKRYFDTVREELFPVLREEKFTPGIRLQRTMRYRSKMESRAKFVIQVLTNPLYGERCRPELKKFLESIRELGGEFARELNLPEEQVQAFIMVTYSTMVADRIFNCSGTLEEEMRLLEQMAVGKDVSV